MNGFTIALSELITQSLGRKIEKNNGYNPASELTNSVKTNRKVYRNPRRSAAMNESIEKNALTLLAERLNKFSAHVMRDPTNPRPSGESWPARVDPMGGGETGGPCPSPGEPDQEVDVKVRMKPACPARDLKVVVTLTGPNGAPPFRIGGARAPGRPCNENRREVFD
jgi:hypothetical protein